MTTLESGAVRWKPTEDVSWLACRAAVELDAIARGQNNIALKFVDRLANELSQLGTSARPSYSQAFLIDPVTEAALYRAVGELGSQVKIRTVEELLREGREIANDLKALSSPSSGRHRKKIDQLKTFCLALSEQLLALEEPYLDLAQHAQTEG